MTESAAEQFPDDAHAPVGTSIKKNGAGAPKKNTLRKLMARATTGELDKPAALRRRKMRFTVDHAVCDPGGFEEDFQLVLESPSTEVELAAIKKYGADNPGAIALEMARLCLVSIDGDPLSDGDLSRDAVWEALGSKGRGLVVQKWNELSGGGQEADARKKADSSTRLIV